MTIYLTIEEALAIGVRATGTPPFVRDPGGLAEVGDIVDALRRLS